MGSSHPDRDDRDPRFLVDRTLGRLARWLRLLGYDSVEVLLVRDDVLTDQSRQLRIEAGVHVRGRARCLVCNGALEERAVDEARSHVPTYVARTQTHFSYCPACERYTWRGTHCESARALLEHAGIFVGGSSADGRS